MAAFAHVHDSYNAVMITCDAAEDLMFYGKGAGQYPTASALVSDILNAANTPGGLHPTYNEEVTVQESAAINKDWQSKYYIRINLVDRPRMLSKVADVLGQCDISLAKVIQTEITGSYVPVIFLTHKTLESNIQKAIKMLEESLGADCDLRCLVRVEDVG